jgi:hypothetical protein
MATRTRTRHPTNRPKPDLPSTGSFAESFPHSTKVYVEGARGVRVPMREISLSGGEPPLRVYDTSGPQGFDVREGLPSVRGGWIGARNVESLRGGKAPEEIQRVPRAHHEIASVAALPRNDSCLAYRRTAAGSTALPPYRPTSAA